MSQVKQIVKIENDGQNIISTNYFETTAAKLGYVFLSINAGAFRLLVPDEMAKKLVSEIATAQEVIVTRGAWEAQGGIDAFEIMFEDNSDEPYALFISTQQAHTLPHESDCGKRRLFTVWNSKGKIADLPGWYRIESRIPCLKAYKKINGGEHA